MIAQSLLLAAVFPGRQPEFRTERRKRPLAAVRAVTLFSLLCLACPPGTAAQPSSTASPLSLEAAIPAPNPRVQVTAVRQTVLSSQLSGRIAEMTVRDGDSFLQGQVLARLDCAVQTAHCKRAEAALRKQKALYTTTQKLARLNSRSQLEVDAAKADADQAQADLAVAQALADRCEIKAPFAGRVTGRMAQDNQYINEGQALLEIVDSNDLELEFIAPSQWLSWFAPGHPFTVRIDETGREYRATLLRLSGKVDAVSRSIKAYARLDDHDPNLLPGMSGEARISPPPAKE